MQQKKNVLFLASWYPSKVAPKNGNFVEKHGLAASLYANVFMLFAVSKKQKGKFQLEINQNLNVTECRVYYKKVLSKIPFISTFIKYRRLMTAYKLGYTQILKKAGKIDLVHLNIIYPAGIFALKLNKKFKLKYIISEHWSAFLDQDPYSFSFIEKYFIKKIGNNASYICPVSTILREAIKEFGIENKFEIVPNVVDVQCFKYYSKSNDNIVKFLHISNFREEHKNISGMLRVIKKLSEETTEFVFTFAGDGNLELLKKQVEELKIPKENIKLEGAKSTEEVAQLMNQNDAFVLFSHCETFSCVIAEALVTGTPVVLTDVCGIAGDINEFNGLLVKDNDEAGLLKQLLYFMKNKSRYDAAQIRNEAVKKYSMEVVGKQFDEIYNAVLNS